MPAQKLRRYVLRDKAGAQIAVLWIRGILRPPEGGTTARHKTLYTRAGHYRGFVTDPYTLTEDVSAAVP